LERGAGRLMLDPSLLLNARGFNALRSAVQEDPAAEYFVPASVYYNLTELTERRHIERILPQFTPPRNAARLDEVGAFFTNTPNVQPYTPVGLAATEGNDEARLMHARLRDAMPDDPVYVHVLYEEWGFLTSESWIASRTKRTFQAFKRAGAIAVEFPREAFDAAARRTPHVVPANVQGPLTRNQRLRAVTKWVAAGGVIWAGLLNPILGMAAGSAAGIFALYDP
jgi:hypothetical protein